MLRKQTDQSHAEIDLPEDLRAWIREDRLILFALEAVWDQHLCMDSEEDATNSVRMIPVIHTVLTFSYSIGLFPTSDIERSVPRNESLHLIAEGCFPSEEAIRQFRRSHRQDLVRSLATVFQACIAEHLGTDGLSQNQLTALADERISHAIQRDSMAWDV